MFGRRRRRPPNRSWRAEAAPVCALMRAASAATGKQSANPSPPAPRTPNASSSTERLAEQPCRDVRLLHAQPQIGGRDQDAGAQQNPLAAALRRRRPHRFEDLLRFPEIAAVVERKAVAQRGMARRHVAAKSRRHQSCDLRQRFVIGGGLLETRRAHRPIAAAADCLRLAAAWSSGRGPGKKRKNQSVTRPVPASRHRPATPRLRIPKSHPASPPALHDAADVPLPGSTVTSTGQ